MNEKDTKRASTYALSSGGFLHIDRQIIPIQMKQITEYLKTIGSKGGKKSRRTLTKAQARAMVRAREKKRKATK